jgi:hypothetical protein
VLGGRPTETPRSDAPGNGGSPSAEADDEEDPAAVLRAAPGVARALGLEDDDEPFPDLRTQVVDDSELLDLVDDPDSESSDDTQAAAPPAPVEGEASRPSPPPLPADAGLHPDEPLIDVRTFESPTALDRAIAEAAAADWEARAAMLSAALEAAPAGDKERIGALAYELGELLERRLDDEARAVKAYGRALQSDPSLRPNLWAIRRVFYRRALWPNLIKLIDAELRFARDDLERADL